MDVSETPLCVDLDGTLVHCDTLVETMLLAIKQQPLVLFKLPLWLAGGRAQLKARLAASVNLDVATLPYRTELLDYLRQQHSLSRPLYLVSAADQSIVSAVADHLQLFEGAWGSDGVNNLKGLDKRHWLEGKMTQGYAYAGDSRADLPVWEGANAAVVVSSDKALRSGVRSICEVEKEYPGDGATLLDWMRALRMHQWSKNLLVFVPLLLSGDLRPQSVLLVLVAFALLGLTCSGTYLINDLLDLQEDRRHWSKRHRAIAAGSIAPAHALGVSLALTAVSMSLAWFYLPHFAVWLTLYLATTLVYTLYLKQVPILDLMTLGGLFTCRVGMGVAVLGHQNSVWLFLFTAFFFFGLAAVKRYVEIGRAINRQEPGSIRSAYVPEDLNLVLVASVAAGLASLIVMALYLESGASPAGTYGSPEWLWCTLPILGLWLGRVWLLAGRLQLTDDPVTFALTDRVSWLLGAFLVISVALSHTGG